MKAHLVKLSSVLGAAGGVAVSSSMKCGFSTALPVVNEGDTLSLDSLYVSYAYEWSARFAIELRNSASKAVPTSRLTYSIGTGLTFSHQTDQSIV